MLHTKREIAKLKSELEVIAKENEEASFKLSLRAKQFQLLLCVIEELQQTLAAEDKQKEEALEPTDGSMEIDSDVKIDK